MLVRTTCIAAAGVFALCIGQAAASGKPAKSGAAVRPSKSSHAQNVSLHASASYFLAANPHVPLATVQDGTIGPAVAPEARGKSCGSKRRWGTPGTSWRVLDAWGQVKTSATVKVADFYDVTGCAEVYFAPNVEKNVGSVFVSADSAYVAPASAHWAAPRSARSSFQTVLERVTTGFSQDALPGTCAEITESTRYFRYDDDRGVEQRLAVGGGAGGYVIAELGVHSWKVAHTERATKKEPVCYRPVAVFDMNGDGTPEIVMRFVEFTGEWWGDLVLARNKAGKWAQVAMSPGGSSA